MPAYYLQPVLPWSRRQQEDRRFRQILIQSLAIFFMAGLIMPYLPVPQIESDWEVDSPPRLARIIAERIEPATESPATRRPKTQLPVAKPKRERDKAPIPIPRTREPSAQATARQKAAKAGILALSDSLTEMRNIAPKITVVGSDRKPATGTGTSEADKSKSSMLTAGVTKGSGGIDGDISAHHEFLGAPELRARIITSGRSRVNGESTVPATGKTKGSKQKNVRSEEEIQEILDRNKSAIYAIYNRELRKDPTLKGKVVVSITIAPSGQVTRCTIIYSELQAAALEKKLVLLVKRIDFGAKPGVPVVTTKVPIEFFPV